ncbi:SMC-Scp complex subunit ScpB [Lichenicoccus sp.]|uniref:SMC-Scp complex subunit ScpB n=1 Tax=Lichenicoccus sp. TaxID=2781899 RepID=UPI003D10AF6D
MSEAEPPGLALRLAEAMIFASAEPVSERALLDMLDSQQALEGSGVEALRRVLDALVLRYAQSGVRPVQVAGGWQFRTAPDLAPCLTRIVQRPRRLPRAAMETLSVIAYHQPCTRTEIEEIRGVALGQATLDSLLEASLIAPCGRKEVPGRPVLWSTSAAFLRHFGLRDLRDLPRREELLLEPTVPAMPEAC